MNSPDQTHARALGNMSEDAAVRNPRPPTLMPRIGVGEPATSRATRNIVPSPPNTRIRSACCVNWRAPALPLAFSPARSAVALSERTTRPASTIIEAAFWTAGRQATLSGLAIRPTRLILLASFFKQRQKFLVARRAEQRRFRHAQPAQGSAGGNERRQFAHHALVDRRVGDDTGALVGFDLSGLKLRFDQGHNLAAAAHQSGGSGQDLPQ